MSKDWWKVSSCKGRKYSPVTVARRVLVVDSGAVTSGGGMRDEIPGLSDAIFRSLAI